MKEYSQSIYKNKVPNEENKSNKIPSVHGTKACISKVKEIV